MAWRPLGKSLMANSKRRCLNCKAYFAQDIMLRTPVGYFHTHSCASEYAQNKRQAIKDKKTAKDTAERKKRLKTRSDWLKDAQKVVNEYVRLYRDAKHKCISCDQPANSQANYWDAGHYRSRGASPELRFNTLNIHKQCKRCNRELSGNVVNMRLGLIQRYGEDYVSRIEQHHQPLKADIEYLQRLIKVFKAKIKLYKKLRKND